MLFVPRKNGLDSLSKEVGVFKEVFQGWLPDRRVSQFCEIDVSVSHLLVLRECLSFPWFRRKRRDDPHNSWGVSQCYIFSKPLPPKHNSGKQITFNNSPPIKNIFKVYFGEFKVYFGEFKVYFGDIAFTFEDS